MEKIKVNMSPNPLDVQTIHASQNDGEARQWEFELHNNGELIDTSDVKEQLFFKAYKGGTEEILPTNGSTPTTSPFIGDIKYPQGLLTDQEFLYRESPTEEDGLAKITDIKGNTLVWNQLINPSSYSYGTLSGITTSASGTGGVHIEGTATATAILALTVITTIANHKYLLLISNTAINGLTVLDNSSPRQFEGVTTSVMFTSSGANINAKLRVANGTSINAIVYPMLFDLTQMGYDSIVDPSEFTSIFSLPYYDYNQGSLLSFNGNGIKTVGFNQWDGETERGYIYNGVTYASNNYWQTKNYIHVIPNETYYFNVPSAQCQITLYDANKNYVSSVNSMGGSTHLVTIPSGCYFARFCQPISSDSSTVCVNISSSRNGEYEPYTSSALSLPISTYFPTGIKSAGSVYDELTESKAITRVGSRAYQSGDESDTSVITDGTTTYYALATPTETPITTASLVTENAEIPLSNNDGVLLGKCTEQLSENPGFIDAKIKLTDADGECYSNKIQLHVERKPS